MLLNAGCMLYVPAMCPNTSYQAVQGRPSRRGWLRMLGVSQVEKEEHRRSCSCLYVWLYMCEVRCCCTRCLLLLLDYCTLCSARRECFWNSRGDSVGSLDKVRDMCHKKLGVRNFRLEPFYLFIYWSTRLKPEEWIAATHLRSARNATLNPTGT